MKSAKNEKITQAFFSVNIELNKKTNQQRLFYFFYSSR